MESLRSAQMWFKENVRVLLPPPACPVNDIHVSMHQVGSINRFIYGMYFLFYWPRCLMRLNSAAGCMKQTAMFIMHNITAFMLLSRALANTVFHTAPPPSFDMELRNYDKCTPTLVLWCTTKISIFNKNKKVVPKLVSLDEMEAYYRIF